jgi:hydrogenase-4 transcriptional activator
VTQDKNLPGQGVIDLERVRSEKKVRTVISPAFKTELDSVRDLLDKGLSTEAKLKLSHLLSGARNEHVVLARARCLLSVALEMEGLYKDSLDAVRVYESAAALAPLDSETEIRVRIQLGLAYNYTGDQPRAIGLLNSALREATEVGSHSVIAEAYAALARVYRAINEYKIARDHSQKAHEHYRETGEWRGLAEAYFGLALADTCEGDYESGIENFEQAVKLVGDHPATSLLGKIYANMAGACWFLKRPQEGIRHLEKAIAYYERTEHTANAALGYNNLGINLILVGEWDRARTALERALELVGSIDERGSKIPTILDSIGELHLLRGELNEAREVLERAVALADQNGNKWYAGQATRTMGRCLIALGEHEEALRSATESLEMAEQIGDRRAICESRLLIAEANLFCGRIEECSSELESLTNETAGSEPDLGFSGETQRLLGKLFMERRNWAEAAQHFGRSASIFEILGDRYRGARAHFELGRAHAHFQPARAAEHLQQAINTFRRLGARIDLEAAEAAYGALDTVAVEAPADHSGLAQLLTVRLAEATASRELLLRELAAVVRQETSASTILLIEPGDDNINRVVASSGVNTETTAAIVGKFEFAVQGQGITSKSLPEDSAVFTLRSPNSAPAILYIEPRDAAVLGHGIAIDPLLRVVELGMDVCALRTRSTAVRNQQETPGANGSSIMPGFIHSSPPMAELVEEVQKIRSSDVTVLITGESGTGKELVARAIHSISSRRSKVFLPFNCTAVPKDLAEAHLFGYRRGSFTGATSDSIGVIRSAEGGTLFLDEVGDLPIDVQPKLLRFLQEGEIQPLGERRPVRVDVRILAATNTDLEEMVTEGRFREDLYYRLNVIRLKVPPLRERQSEIPPIVAYYIDHFSEKMKRRDIRITSQALDLLMVSDWPGNVRQLTNEIQRIIARAEDGTVITPDHLSEELRQMRSPAAGGPAIGLASISGSKQEGVTLAEAVAELERRMIADAMRRHSGNISRVAKELGLTRRGLYLKLGRHAVSASA